MILWESLRGRRHLFADDDRTGLPTPGGYLLVNAGRFGHAIIPGVELAGWEAVLLEATGTAEKVPGGFVGAFSRYFPAWVCFFTPGGAIRFPSYECSW